MLPSKGLCKGGRWSKPLLLKALLTLPVVVLFATATAQNRKDSTSDQQATSPKPQSRFQFSGLLITKYVQSLTKDVDVTGKQVATGTPLTASSFLLKKARVQAKVQVMPRAEGTVLVNLADFLGDPKNKVLETATLKYYINDYLHLQVGQFRPYFGLEDLYPEELLRTLDWSNGYNAFGANGWQGFQVGATVYGEWTNSKVPLKYYLGVFNGNGKNQVADNDNGKLFPARVELGLGKTKLGLNGGLGKENGRQVWASGVDIDHTTPLGSAWSLQLQSEYKCGVNSAYFTTLSPAEKSTEIFTGCLIENYYILPNLVYTVNGKDLKSLELSVRYEYLDPDVKYDGNVKKTCTPMLSASLAEAYALRLEMGVVVDKWSRNLPGTTQYNNCRCVCQLQARF